MLTLLLSMILDITWFGVYAPDVLEGEAGPHSGMLQYAFSVSLISFLIKPVTVYYVYQLCGGIVAGSYQPTDAASTAASRVQYHTDGMQAGYQTSAAAAAPDTTTI